MDNKNVNPSLILGVVLLVAASCGTPTGSSAPTGGPTVPGGDSTTPPVTPAAALGTDWVSMPSTAGSLAWWNSGVADGAGGVVAAGQFGGPSSTWTLAPSVSASSGKAYKIGAVAHYNDQGVAQWVRTLTGSGTAAMSYYSAVTQDGQGNLWAVGTAQGYFNPIIYGPAQTISLPSSPYWGASPVLVEFSSDGTAQRAISLAGTNSQCEYLSVACDASGNVYAAGYFSGQYSVGTSYFPSTITVGQTAAQKGTKDYTQVNAVATGANPLLVKYDSSGNFVWAKALYDGPAAGAAQYNAVVVSGAAVYVAGYLTGTGTYKFGTAAASVSAAGSSANQSPLVVKFDLDGSPAWALTRTAGADNFSLTGLAADPSGNLTAVGTVTGTGASTFTAGAGLVAGTGTRNPAVVAIDTAGTVRWARTLASGTGDYYLYAVTADANGRVYAAGTRKTPVDSGFGDGVTLPASSKTLLPFVLVYDTAGKSLGSAGVSSASATSNSEYYGVASPAVGKVVAVGGLTRYGSDSFDFGGGVTKTPAVEGTNALAAEFTLP